MRNEELWGAGDGGPAAQEATGGTRQGVPRQRLRGVAGQLRPYRDVRSGFESWRRLALREWAAREESPVVH